MESQEDRYLWATDCFNLVQPIQISHSQREMTPRDTDDTYETPILIGLLRAWEARRSCLKCLAGYVAFNSLSAVMWFCAWPWMKTRVEAVMINMFVFNVSYALYLLIRTHTVN